MTALEAALSIDDRLSGPARRIGRIPVRNLWLLFLYASDLAAFAGRFNARLIEDDADLSTLAARILTHAVERRLRRNLSRGCRPQEAWSPRVRGRIDLLQTETRRLLERGRVACRYEAFTVDTPRNRLARAALDAIAHQTPDRGLSRRCRMLSADLGRAGVSGRRPAAGELAADVIGRNEIEDRFMVAAARLALDLALPTEDEGPVALTAADRDATAARKLFERAVAGFYEVELSAREGWRTRRGTPLAWRIDAATPGARAILPTMRIDIMLENPGAGRRIVIDTKFTDLLRPGWRRDRTLQSGHLYQIYAYLRSQVGGDSLADAAEGLLLHPAVDAQEDEAVVIQGHPIRFATVDLAAAPRDIRSRLLALIQRPDLRPPDEKSPTRTPG